MAAPLGLILMDGLPVGEIAVDTFELDGNMPAAWQWTMQAAPSSLLQQAAYHPGGGIGGHHGGGHHDEDHPSHAEHGARRHERHEEYKQHRHELPKHEEEEPQPGRHRPRMHHAVHEDHKDAVPGRHRPRIHHAAEDHKDDEWTKHPTKAWPKEGEDATQHDVGHPVEGAKARLAKEREPLVKQLSDPDVRRRFMSLTQAENPEDPQAFMEGLLNRSSARKHSLSQEMSSSYYPPASKPGGKHYRELSAGNARSFESALENVTAGSNKVNFATGNASLNVGFGYGHGANDPHTYKSPINNERYGIENSPADIAWAARMRAGGGAQPTSADARLGGDWGPSKMSAAPHITRGVDPDLVAAAHAGSSLLPPGYRVEPSSGVRNSGQGQHTKGNALDVKIYDDKGNYIGNRGDDPTGMYERYARGAYGYAKQHFPHKAARMGWGGAFDTSAGSGVADPMHLDFGGERGLHHPGKHLSKLGPLYPSKN